MSANINQVVIMDQSGRVIPFEIIEAPVWDNKNGYLCVSVQSDKNELFQVNGINTDEMQLVYIRAGNEGSFSSDPHRSKIKRHVKSEEFQPGTNIELTGKSKLYQGDQSFRVTFTLTGTIPEPISIITY